jgi:rhodanese-related sulfurtransferase
MSAQPGRLPAISPRDAAAALDQGAGDPSGPLLVDVRERDEFATRRAAGAVLLPISEFLARHGELPRDRPLLVICESGSRSASASMFLLQKGWTDVKNVEGGTQAWAMAGLPTRTGPPAPDEGDLPR